jgi:hypothetical protein
MTPDAIQVERGNDMSLSVAVFDPRDKGIHFFVVFMERAKHF